MDRIQTRLAGWQPIGLIVTLLALALAASFAPIERTLGVNLRLILVHGAWAWTGQIAFGLAAICALPGLLLRRAAWHDWSQAWGRTGMLFWLTYLPMSLLVMQLNWGGLFFDEPRWRIPFTFAVVGVLLQAGMLLINSPVFTSAGNLFFGAALWWSLRNAANVLHPDSPIGQSNSLNIQLAFGLLLALILLAALQIAAWWKQSKTP